MSDGGQQFILKFFSGPHAGAEVLLPPGDYTLGGAESCDIVIHDEAVAPRHARLRIAATEIRLTPLDRAVTVAGSPIEGETAVAFRQIATLGTTHFGVAPTGETWDSVTLPDLPQVSATRMREEAAAVEPVVPPAPAASAGIPKSASVKRPKWRSRRLASLGIAVIVCGLAIMSLYGNIRPTAASLPESSIRPPGVDGQVKTLLAELKIDQVHLTRSEQGDWQLGGYVADAEQKRRLAAALRERGLRVRSQVWSPDELLESARAVLTGMSLPLAVSYAGPGVLTLSGDAPDNQSVARVAEILQRDIPGLRKLDNRVAAAARGSAGDRPIAPVLSAGASRAAPQLAIKSVSLGSVRFVVTADGAKYLEGASLANGFILKAIREDGLVLSNGDQDIIYHFGRG